MEWISYISPAVRLIDIHDSSHSLGIAGAAPHEERAGRGDGLWLAVAVNLLEYLGQNDDNEEWIPLGDFVDTVAESYGLDEGDVQYVVNFLATPSRINFLTDLEATVESVRSTKETALIDRPWHQATNRCRLTNTGRQAIQMAKVSGNLFYARHDAEKLLTAIRLEDFSQIVPQCSSITQVIRSFSQDITRTLERPGDQEAWQLYAQKKDDYLDAINEVGQTALNAEEAFTLSSTLERFDSWNAGRVDKDVQQGVIHQALKELRLAVIALSRKFNKLVEQLADQSRNVIGNVDFTALALSWVVEPPSKALIDHTLNVFAPWTVDASFPSAADLYGSVRDAKSEDSSVVLCFDENEDQTLPPILATFLEKYGMEIIDELKSGHEISLSKVIEMGWSDLSETTPLSELIGVYSVPDWLQENQIAVTFSHGSLDIELPDSSSLHGDELIMFMLD